MDHGYILLRVLPNIPANISFIKKELSESHLRGAAQSNCHPSMILCHCLAREQNVIQYRPFARNVYIGLVPAGAQEAPYPILSPLSHLHRRRLPAKMVDFNNLAVVEQDYCAYTSRSLP